MYVAGKPDRIAAWHDRHNRNYLWYFSASASASLAAATLLAASVTVDGALQVTVVALSAPNSADNRAALLFMSISSRASPELGSHRPTLALLHLFQANFRKELL